MYISRFAGHWNRKILLYTEIDTNYLQIMIIATHFCDDLWSMFLCIEMLHRFYDVMVLNNIVNSYCSLWNLLTIMVHITAG